MMDWPSLLVGLALGILGNLLTPSVRHALIKAVGWTGSRVNRMGEKSLRLRLGQLEQEYVRVGELRNDPLQLIGLVMQSVMSVLFVTWSIIVIVFFISFSGLDGSAIPKYWYGAIGGIVGVGTRWFINALVVWSLVDKVRDFEEFEKRNVSNCQKIDALLNRSLSKPA